MLADPKRRKEKKINWVC